MKDFKTKVSTFFSYYKWYILIALFFVITLTVMGVQMCSREKYDISVMYAGNAILSDTASAEIEKAFVTLGEEKDKALLYELVIMNDEEIGKAYEKGYPSTSVSPERVRKNKKMLAMNVMGDEYFILMLSPECYNIMLSNGTLEKLDDIGVATGDKASLRADDYSVKLHELDFVKKYKAFSVLPSDTVVCFKKISEMNEKKKTKLKKRADDLEIFAKMVSYTEPAASASTVAAAPNGKEYLPL